MITFAEQDCGFMAGYAVVKDGYRKLAFLGGMAVPAVIRFGYGFVEGAEAAAKDLGLEEGALPEGWTTVDSDGDGNTWSTHTNTGTGNYNTHGGDGVAISASYIDAALTPDNWLITPKLDLGGTMRVWLCGQDASWAGEGGWGFGGQAGRQG